MAGGKIVGITVSIEGQTSGLTKSLKEANSSLSKTTSALKDVDKALKLDPSNVELLTQKQGLLTDAIEDTEKKLEVMRQVAEDAAKGLEQGTVTKEQYAQLTAEIVKTEHSLSELENEATQTANSLDGVADPETAQSIDELGDQTEETGEQMQESSTKIDIFGSAMDALSNPVALATGALALFVEMAKTGISIIESIAGAALDAAEAIGTTLYNATKDGVDMMAELEKELAGYTKEGARYADQVNTTAKKIGITTDEVQQLQFAAELVDVSLDTISGSMTKNLKAMSTAAKATKDKTNDTAEAYKQLGVEIKDANGNLRDSSDVFWDVIDGLAQMESGADRDLMAMTLLGKSAKELNPLILTGSEGMKKFAQMAQESGYVLDSKVLNSYQQLDDSLRLLDNGFVSLKNGLGLIFLPLLNDLATDGVSLLSQFSKGIVDANGDVEKIGAVIQKTVPEAISAIMKNLPKWISVTNDLIHTILQSILDNLPEILDGIFSIIETIADTLLAPDNIQKIMDAITSIIEHILIFIDQHGEELIDIGVKIIVALIEGLARAIPRLAPAMANAITTIIEALTKPETLNSFINAAILMILAIAKGLSDAMPQLLESIPKLVEALCQAIEVLTPLIMEVGTQLFEALLDSGAIQRIVETLGPFLLDMLVMIGKEIIKNGPEIGGAFLEVFVDLGHDAVMWGADIIANLLAGIESMRQDLKKKVSSVASDIADFLGFSVPDKGPLKDFDKSGPDMIDLFASGIESELPTLEAALNVAANTISTGMSPDYTGQLNGLNEGLASLADAETQIVVPVYIGDERIETSVVKATRTANYLSGGR